MIHIRGRRESTDSWFVSICSARSWKERTLVHLASFGAIADLEPKLMCKMCLRIYNDRFEGDPEHPEYNLILMSHV